MLKTKITPLYERLSRDDELQGESNSISNHLHLTLCWVHPKFEIFVHQSGKIAEGAIRHDDTLAHAEELGVNVVSSAIIARNIDGIRSKIQSQSVCIRLTPLHIISENEEP